MFMSQAFVLRRLENAVITAVCRYLMDDCEGAFRDMETAWELAKDNGLFMPFFEMGKDMRTLAGAALKAKSINIPQKELENIQRNAAAYAKNIYAVSEYFRETAAESQGFALTNREIEVLVCLSQGLTQREIGLQNAISINTVKSAVRIIYNKLGAINKSDAIRIATQKKIL
jgi:LuxR family maltose regulon positive regulatory protein